MIFWLKLPCLFQMPDRCFMLMWHGTQLLKALCNTLRYDDISMLLLCLLCVMNVLWMCYESVMRALWKCYESVMKVLWMCYACVVKVLWKCYGCVMDVLWVCYGCVMGVFWVCFGCVMDVLWMCEVCYWCVKDVCVMDDWWIFYIYCVCCKWYCNCDIVVALWYNCYVNYCILFFRVFYYDQINLLPQRRSLCYLRYSRTRNNGAQWDLGLGHGAVSASGHQQTAGRPATRGSGACRGLQVVLKIAHSRQLVWQRAAGRPAVDCTWCSWTFEHWLYFCIFIWMALGICDIEHWT